MIDSRAFAFWRIHAYSFISIWPKTLNLRNRRTKNPRIQGRLYSPYFSFMFNHWWCFRLVAFRCWIWIFLSGVLLLNGSLIFESQNCLCEASEILFLMCLIDLKACKSMVPPALARLMCIYMFLAKLGNWSRSDSLIWRTQGLIPELVYVSNVPTPPNHEYVGDVCIWFRRKKWYM